MPVQVVHHGPKVLQRIHRLCVRSVASAGRMGGSGKRPSAEVLSPSGFARVLRYLSKDAVETAEVVRGAAGPTLRERDRKVGRCRWRRCGKVGRQRQGQTMNAALPVATPRGGVDVAARVTTTGSG